MSNNIIFKTIGMLLMLFSLNVTFAPIASAAETDSATSADAASGGKIGESMCNIVKLLTGRVGKAIATVAIIFLAFGLFVGKLSWGVAIATAVGIAAMFGADTILEILGVSDGPNCK
jgi:type IV secretory pathway VirB2 component (pilin)